ncbi:hypothetical protein Q8A67_016600 [Cirrhinus molitorella]|uniref:Rho-GAP domain-containing protein n=1 Tax=Cirrhinus molitorella TaxID=172907 RepID=A0AA88PLR1_9TELE|nr:hypothetical protein Q8A67_016600 [Cirrhinus molitorella]
MRQGLPLVLTHIVEFVERHCLDKTGLFRLPGSVKRCQELRKHFDEGGFPEFDIGGDILTSASLLKTFIRELPGGLIPEPQMTQLLKVYNNQFPPVHYCFNATTTKGLHRVFESAAVTQRQTVGSV